MTPTIPANVEPWNVLETCFPAALERVWRFEDRDDWGKTPGIISGQIFDCPNGVRIIVSREGFGDRNWIHVSASVNEGHPLWSQLKRSRNPAKRFLQEVHTSWMLIAGKLGLFLPELPETWSDKKGVPHWRIMLDGLAASAR